MPNPTERQYHEMIANKKRVEDLEAQRFYEVSARGRVAQQLSAGLSSIEAEFFIAGFTGDNPKFSKVGNINDFGASAKEAYKSGKLAFADKESQRLIRVETVKVRDNCIKRNATHDALHEAYMLRGEGYAKMGPEGWDE